MADEAVNADGEEGRARRWGAAGYAGAWARAADDGAHVRWIDDGEAYVHEMAVPELRTVVSASHSAGGSMEGHPGA